MSRVFRRRAEASIRCRVLREDPRAANPNRPPLGSDIQKRETFQKRGRASEIKDLDFLKDMTETAGSSTPSQSTPRHKGRTLWHGAATNAVWECGLDRLRPAQGTQ